MSETRAKNRPERTPLAARNRLTFRGKDPGFVYRYINDTEDRLERAREAGYEFVVSDESPGDKRVAEATKMGAKVSKQVGGGTTAFLMRIPKEYYEDDQKAKTSKINELEKSLKPNKTQNQYGEGLTKE
jgi:hypothetical protein